jgi:hypothetical protein
MAIGFLPWGFGLRTDPQSVVTTIALPTTPRKSIPTVVEECVTAVVAGAVAVVAEAAVVVVVEGRVVVVVDTVEEGVVRPGFVKSIPLPRDWMEMSATAMATIATTSAPFCLGLRFLSLSEGPLMTSPRPGSGSLSSLGSAGWQLTPWILYRAG